MFKPLLAVPVSYRKQKIGQLYGSSLPLAIAEYCQQISGIKLIIAPDNLTANQLLGDIAFFLPIQAKQELLFFPDWETLPYDHFSPHQDIISERLKTLSRLSQVTDAIVISSTATLMHRLCPPVFLHQHAFILAQGQVLELDKFRAQLQMAGYHAVANVLEHGEYAQRGSIIDVFPMGSSYPFRLELFDHTIESLRQFDPDSQQTIQKITHITILPAKEFALNEQSIALFRQKFRAQFAGNAGQCSSYEAISQKQLFAGVEYYLPLFFDQTADFFTYLNDQASIFLVDDILNQAKLFWQELTTRFDQYRYDVSRPLLEPKQCYLMPEELLAQVNNFKQIHFFHQPQKIKAQTTNLAIINPPMLPIARQDNPPLKKLADYLMQHQQRFLLVVESAGRREVLQDLLKQSGIHAITHQTWDDFLKSAALINITTGPLITGCELSDVSITIIVESQLFGEQAGFQRRSQQKTFDPDLIIRNLAELQLHAPVVHLQFGVGRYQGLQAIDSNGITNEFLILSYAGNDKIYVPITSLHLISRYTGVDHDHAPLHKLGSDLWQKEKKKAGDKIHDIAIELLEIYAKRQAKLGFSYHCQPEDYQRFVAGFPFIETPDQQRAIEQIFKDMQSSQPMDRLICGDVGFGKTEVAMRAAFLAIQNNKQVCVLVPTTLLARQHYDNFRDRFAPFAINIDLLSRARSGKDASKVINALEKGSIDIIIGTHKLFSATITFKNLGLLIIDEEHRFGVKQKEHIKSLRLNVDILSMTATPIPRTLNMAMNGIRDISLISTPPAKRLAIKTFWQEKTSAIVREALIREILRGGQVFFLHNAVQTIERVRENLQLLVPEARIKCAHGQMPERMLETIMSDFYHHRFNVLVCTTIIETGIDIPTANTIIIDSADKFGLAQLHQLRGRVGRSYHQAYAYLLTPPVKSLTPDAVKRLEAIVSIEDLGAGFMLASHDMEIRGAGELLGDDQSGHMHAIGFNLFMEMLDKAVSDLKSGKNPSLASPIRQGPDIELRVSTIIPENYIFDVHTRLIIYKRIASATHDDQLKALQIELIDRFGLLPQSVKQLFSVMTLKLLAMQLGISKITADLTLATVEFSDQPHINAQKLIELIQQQASRFQLTGASKLRINLCSELAHERINDIKQVLTQLISEN